METDNLIRITLTKNEMITLQRMLFDYKCDRDGHDNIFQLEFRLVDELLKKDIRDR